MSELPAPSTGAHDIPQSCRRLCFSSHGLDVAGVVERHCYCFNKSVKIETFSPMSNSLACTNGIVFDTNTPMLAGYSELTYSTGYSSSVPSYCAPLEIGGMYKCGAENNVRRAAAIYFMNWKHWSPVSQSPLSKLSVIIEKDVDVDILDVITMKVDFIECCESKPYDVRGTSSCKCYGPIRLAIDLGDGSVYEAMLSVDAMSTFALVHFYEDPGVFKIKAEAANSPSSPPVTWSSKVTVEDPVEPIILGNILQEATSPRALTPIRAIALSGSKMLCTWNYGDDSLEDEIYVDELPIPVTYHRYQRNGFFTVTLVCRNRMGERTLTNLATVQTPATGLVVVREVVVELGKKFSYEWSVTGSHVDCIVFFGNLSLPNGNVVTDIVDEDQSYFIFNQSLNRGRAVITTDLYAPGLNASNDSCVRAGLAATYPVVLTCYNSVTSLPPSAVTFVSFEEPIKGMSLVVSENKVFLNRNENFCLKLEILGGSNVIIEWNLDDENHPEKDVVESCGQDGCYHR